MHHSKEGNHFGLFVGDDTGLLKRFTMSLTFEDDIISAPVVRKKRNPHKRGAPESGLPLDLEEAVTAAAAEGEEEVKEEAVIRSRANFSFKATGKSGSQVKDEGLKYLRWSIQQKHELSTDYVSFVRGKSNVVQVFDTQTETLWASKAYP